MPVLSCVPQGQGVELPGPKCLLLRFSEGDGHLTYFSIAGTKHLDQGNSLKKVFNWAYSSTGLEPEMAEQRQNGRYSWELTTRPTSMGQRAEWE